MMKSQATVQECVQPKASVEPDRQQLEEVAEFKSGLRSRKVPEDFDWHQSVMEMAYLRVIGSLVALFECGQDRRDDLNAAWQKVHEAILCLLAAQKGETPNSIQKNVYDLLDRVRLSVQKAGGLVESAPVTEENNEAPSLLEWSVMRLGVIYGPVGYVDLGEEPDDMSVHISSPRWKEVRDRINAAISDDHGFPGPGGKVFSARDASNLHTVLHRMTEGELSFVEDQTVTP